MNFLKRLAKNAYNKISSKGSHLRKGVDCKHEWYGNQYGGFFVHPALLNNNSVVYSFGIGEDISFDQAIADKHKCTVHGFDPTPKSINWLDGQELPDNFIFHKYGIAEESGEVSFFLPKNPEHVSGSVVHQSNVEQNYNIKVDMKSFTDIIGELKHSKVDILKMDIEGSEYSVLENIFSSNVQINQILVEFHERFFKDGKLKTIKFVERLQSLGFEIFAISDSFEEISFVRLEAL